MENNERNSGGIKHNNNNNDKVKNASEEQHDDLKKRLTNIILTQFKAYLGFKLFLYTLGFGPWGVIAGTFASYIMRFAAVNSIPIGFLISFLQSAGTGLLPSIRFMTQTGVIAFLVQPEVREKLEKIKQNVAAKFGFDADKIKIIAKTEDKSKKGNTPQSKL